MKKSIIKRRKNICEYIERYSAENRCPPSVRDIQREFGIKSTSTVFYDLEYLASENLIGKIGNRFVPNYTESYQAAILEQIARCN